MKEVLLLKCGELILKGLNRKSFEDRLLENIKRRLDNITGCNIYMRQSVIYIWIEHDDTDVDEIVDIVSKIFGINLICRAAVCDKNLESMLATAEEYLSEQIANSKSFKVETKRGDKKFPITSIQTSQKIGGDIAFKYKHLKPDMHNPELTIYFEIREQYAFVHCGAVNGAGGMPIGTSGKAALLLSGGIDSPVAGYMMAKRGLELCAIHFFSYPYTSEKAKEKVIELCEIMSQYTGRTNLYIVPFTNIQEKIRDNCQEEFFTIIMRRFMMKIAQKIAIQNDCGAIITGESLGQVASQTMPAIAVTNDACSIPIFRPVIGMDKEEIIKIARKIGTFETSILPYEDCCTVFTPKHPNTKPKIQKVLEIEKSLDIDSLVDDAVKNTQKIKPNSQKL